MAADHFYVGYFPKAPGPIAAFSRFAAIALLSCGLAAATIGSLSQGPSAMSAWESEPTTLEGTLLTQPYPVLLIDSAQGKQAVLLVNPGKCAAMSGGAYCGPLDDAAPRDLVEAARALHGARVRVTGTRLLRSNLVALELQDGAASIARTGNGSPVPTEPGPPTTLRGTIVDPKCYLGAMRPGEGKVHLACASLCIRGGIPPALAYTDPQGHECLALLASHDGRPANAHFAPLADQQATLTGREFHLAGDLSILFVDGV
ncbi:MAG: hypothetical protein JSR77_00360 [Planctomycetes bacterium]|nr:hypothetical protein [Planctomycetota bacterium]